MFQGASLTCWIVRSSSSAAICSRPVGAPVMSILPIAIVAVLSAWIATHESMKAAFGGPAAATRAGRALGRPGERRADEAEADDERAAALEELLRG